MISRGASTIATNLLVSLDIDGVVGHGEAAPSRSVTGETLDDARRSLAAWAKSPEALRADLEAWEFVPGGHATPAARNAALVAHLDGLGRRRSTPLHRLLNLPEGQVESSITLSLGTVDMVLAEAAQRAEEGWSVFKVKLGGEHDEAVIRSLRDAYPDRRLRVDANEAWSPDVASERLAFLQRSEVEFVEQPLARDQVEAGAELARRFDIPIILDEPVLDVASVVDLVRRDAADGANIKLSKCGGPYEARRIVKVLRDAGWKIMMGCNLESRLGIAAAAAFAGVLDYADLDGHELVSDDPFTGFETPKGLVRTPEVPGVGATLSASGATSLPEPL